MNEPKYGDFVELKQLSDDEERDFIRNMSPELTEDELTEYIENIKNYLGNKYGK